MKKATAAVAAALLALGGVALTAAPASAHTGGVTGVAACEPDGTYKVTWTYAATNVPGGVEAETKAMTTTPGTLTPIDGVDKGGQVYLSVWAEHAVNVLGAPTRTGNWTGTFATVGVPGDHVGEITTMVQTDWKGGPSEDPVGRVTVDGTCEPEEPPVVVPPQPDADEEVRDEIVTDCDADTVTRTLYTRTREYVYDEESNTWSPGEWSEWTPGEPETFPADDVECPPVVPPTEEPPTEEPPTEEPPVEEPPTEEPPVVTPPTEEPPVTPPTEEEPTPTPTPTPVPVVHEEPPSDDLPPVLAQTGGDGPGILGLTAAALAVALCGLSGMLYARYRTMRTDR